MGTGCPAPRVVFCTQQRDNLCLNGHGAFQMFHVCPMAEAQICEEQGLRGSPLLFYDSFSEGHLELSLQLCYCCVHTGKNKKIIFKNPAAVWDSDRVFR